MITTCYLVICLLSFLLGFPIILGAGLKKFLDLALSGSMANISGPLFVGFVSSFFVGLFAIHFLINFVKKFSLSWFVLYRFLLATIILLALW